MARRASISRWLKVYPIWQIGNHWLHRFHRRAAACQETQANTLKRILVDSHQSSFAKDHKLNPNMSVDEFRNSVPVRDYDQLRPYIDRVIKGEVTALFKPGTDILMFAMTSGTMGNPKLIPLTNQSYEDYRLSWLIWGLQAAKKYPGIVLHPFLGLASSSQVQTTENGVACGSVTGFFARNVHGKIETTIRACPCDVTEITDMAERHYVTARFAAQHQNLHTLATANPSTLIHFAGCLKKNREVFVKDIHDGTCQFLSNDSEMQKQLRALPKVAARLEKCSESFLPQEIWPDLGLIGVWMGGALGAYLPKLRQIYGDTPLRDMGLYASEGCMTIPIEDDTSSGVPFVEGSFFEFMPDLDGKDQTTVLTHNLEKGQKYRILLTTSGGLFRYDIGDIVECTGHISRAYGVAPLVRFLSKSKEYGNLTGEKVTAYQIAAVMEKLSIGDTVAEYIVAPYLRQDASQSGYVLLTETLLPEEIVANFDRCLQDLNIEFASKRQSGRLQATQAIQLRPGTFQRLRQQAIYDPRSSEQYKHPFFLTDQNKLEKILSSEFCETSGSTS